MILSKLIFGFILISLQAFAIEKPNSWLCDIKDSLHPSPQPHQVSISLTEPILTEIRYILEDDGTYTSKQKPLITKTLISTWKADKSKCTIKSGFNQNPEVDTYEFIFHCPSVKGSFTLDFKELSGSFYEELKIRNIHRSISFENCHPSPSINL